MLIKLEVLEAIKAGKIDLQFRRWTRASVKPTNRGHLVPCLPARRTIVEQYMRDTACATSTQPPTG